MKGKAKRANSSVQGSHLGEPASMPGRKRRLGQKLGGPETNRRRGHMLALDQCPHAAVVQRFGAYDRYWPHPATSSRRRRRAHPCRSPPTGERQVSSGRRPWLPVFHSPLNSRLVTLSPGQMGSGLPACARYESNCSRSRWPRSGSGRWGLRREVADKR